MCCIIGNNSNRLMKTPTKIITLLSMLLAGSLITTAWAASVIGVDYGPAGTGLSPDELAGAPGVRTGNWNAAAIAGANTTLDLPDGTIMDNAGNIVNGLSLSLFIGNAGGSSTRGNPPGGTAPALSNDGRMFRTVTDKYEGAQGIITITGIPIPFYAGRPCRRPCWRIFPMEIPRLM